MKCSAELGSMVWSVWGGEVLCSVVQCGWVVQGGEVEHKLPVCGGNYRVFVTDKITGIANGCNERF